LGKRAVIELERKHLSAFRELATAQKKYAAALGELVSEIRAWRGDDPVVSMYARVFNKDTVIDLPWDEKAREEYLKEMCEASRGGAVSSTGLLRTAHQRRGFFFE
jgi:hypothetical protein